MSVCEEGNASDVRKCNIRRAQVCDDKPEGRMEMNRFIPKCIYTRVPPSSFFWSLRAGTGVGSCLEVVSVKKWHGGGGRLRVRECEAGPVGKKTENKHL